MMPAGGDPLEKDSAEAITEARHAILKKPSLHKLYEETYRKYQEVLSRCPADGIALELGSGAGLAKEKIPEIVTSEVLEAPGIDRVVNATEMPFADGELRAIFMHNVFHHIADVEAFLREAERCLRPGGRILIVDQHVGPLSKPIFKYIHDEPFDPKARDWRFKSSGRMSGANGALAWIVFKRDIHLFREKFPKLRLESYRPHTALRYWWVGGLKPWTLLPGWAFRGATALDSTLRTLAPELSSFVDIEIVRT